MALLRRRHGPVSLRRRPAFQALVKAIVSQQISAKAADSILARLRQRVSLAPAALAQADIRELREVGLSRSKAEYVGELARFALAGGLRGLGRRSDQEVAERLTEIRGIGLWTAQMFLIFALNRPDVWPVGDGGIQRAARSLYRVRSLSRLEALGDRFRPWRSHAAWYLWRSLGG